MKSNSEPVFPVVRLSAPLDWIAAAEKENLN
jgi:hypothetical protein